MYSKFFFSILKNLLKLLINFLPFDDINLKDFSTSLKSVFLYQLYKSNLSSKSVSIPIPLQIEYFKSYFSKSLFELSDV